MVDERAARLARAGNDVDDARREARLLRQAERLEHAGRRVLRRLDDDRVARRERGPECVHRQQHRRVPRHDDRDDAERLAKRVVEDARAVERDHAPFDLVREPAEVVEPVGDRPELSEHLLVELAVVGNLDLRDLLGALGDQVREPHHQPASARRRQAAPGLVLERPLRGANGAVDVLGARDRDRRPGLSRRRVEGLQRLARDGVDFVAADVQAVRLHRALPSVSPVRTP
jgi:hypothetical protein